MRAICGARWGRLTEKPRIAAEPRRLGTPQDRTGSADAKARSASATATTASTSACQATLMTMASRTGGVNTETGQPMRTSAVKIWLTIVTLLIGVLTLTARSHAVPPNSLPPDIAQTLQAAFVQIRPDGQQQILNAIRALTPGQARQAVVNIRSAPRDYVIKVLVLSDRIRAGLAPADRQRYVNGVWGVSPGDEAFSARMHQQLLGGLQPPAGGTPRFGGGIPPRAFEQAQEELLCSRFTRDNAPPFCAKYFPR